MMPEQPKSKKEEAKSPSAGIMGPGADAGAALAKVGAALANALSFGSINESGLLEVPPARAALLTNGPGADAGASPLVKVLSFGSLKESGLLEVPSAQAALLGDAFSVGCPVWYRERSSSRPPSDGGIKRELRHGTVASLAMDAVTRKLVYRVRRTTNVPSDAAGSRVDLVSEDNEITYAAKCPVAVAAPTAGAGAAEGEILCPRFAAAGVSYTVLYFLEDNLLRIEDGVLPSRIKFRSDHAAMVERAYSEVFGVHEQLVRLGMCAGN